MPEYENVPQSTPEIIALFKFRNKGDYKTFKDLIQKYVFNGEKVFDGMQTKEVKQSWYPHLEKASKYYYGDENNES